MGRLPKPFKPWLPWLLAVLAAWGTAEGAWPLIWHGVILPRAAEGRPGLRALAYDQEGLQGRQTGSYSSPTASLVLERPKSSLQILAVWTAPRDGRYRLRLTCDDYGSLRLDETTLIRLRGVSDHNEGLAEAQIQAGPHLLVLELNNRLGAGGLKAQYQAPGEDQWRLFGPDDLRLVELGNLSTWLKVAGWAQVAPWWALGLAFLVGLVHLLLGRLSRPRDPAGDGAARPLLRLRWVLLGLGLAAAGLLAVDLYLHHHYALQFDYHNRRGYRGPLAGPKESGEVRVAVFGGSGSYGWGQPWDHALPPALERALAPLAPCPAKVLNLAANEQGIYGVYHDVQLYEDLGYDLAVLYIGGADTVPDQPHWSNFRDGNRIFRLSGYMPLAPRLLDEKRVHWGGELAALAHLDSGDAGWAVGAPVRFAVGQAMGQANLMLEQMAKTIAASEEQARAMGKLGKDRPYAFFLDYTEKTLDWLLGRGKAVVVVGEAALNGSLQQRLLVDMLEQKYGPRVVYRDAASLLPIPMSQAFTDGVHFTEDGAAGLAQALAPLLIPLLPCPAAAPAPRR